MMPGAMMGGMMAPAMMGSAAMMGSRGMMGAGMMGAPGMMGAAPGGFMGAMGASMGLMPGMIPQTHVPGAAKPLEISSSRLSLDDTQAAANTGMYSGVGIAVVLGLLVGCFMFRRGGSNDDDDEDEDADSDEKSSSN